MFRKIKSEMKSLTLDLAIEIANMPALPGERQKKEGHVEYLRDLVVKGKFVSPTWAVAVVKSTNQRYRANGQHSSNALIALPSEVTFPTEANGSPLMVTMDTWELDTMDDAHALFDTFDNPRAVRSNVDYMTMVKAAYSDVSHLPSPFLLAIMNGIDLYLATRPEGKHQPSRYRGDVFLTDPVNREFVLWAHGYLDKLNGPAFIGKTGIVAEMYGDYLLNRVVATEFWGYLCSENHPDPDHESRELARTLNDMIRRPTVKTEAFRVRINRVWKRYVRSAATEPIPQLPNLGEAFPAATPA